MYRIRFLILNEINLMLNLMLMFNAKIFKNRLSSKIILSISKSNKIKKETV